MTAFFTLLGPMGWPLAACSIIALAFVVERVIYYARLRNPRAAEIPLALKPAFGLLEANAHKLRADRDEAVSLWLTDYTALVRANLGWLALIGSIAPMIGLLGTVLGMTRAFRAIAGSAGPVSPSILADGLWEAMLTTLVGLSVAIPTLIAVWIFRAIATRHVDRVSGALSRASLAMDDVRSAGETAASAKTNVADFPMRDAAS